MCIAILARAGATISMEQMRNAATNNPDGFGYSWSDGERTYIRKHLSFDTKAQVEFVRDYNRNYDRSPFLIHFRIRSHGDICLGNTHPFRMKDGGAMIHNGVINLAGLPKNTSDTRFFVKNIIDKLPERWYNQPWWSGVIADIIGYSKLCFLWPDKKYMIIGEGKGSWESDVWYSNGSHKYRKVVSRMVMRDADDDVWDAYYGERNKTTALYPVSAIIINGKHAAWCACATCEGARRQKVSAYQRPLLPATKPPGHHPLCGCVTCAAVTKAARDARDAGAKTTADLTDREVVALLTGDETTICEDCDDVYEVGKSHLCNVNAALMRQIEEQEIAQEEQSAVTRLSRYRRRRIIQYDNV